MRDQSQKNNDGTEVEPSTMTNNITTEVERDITTKAEQTATTKVQRNNGIKVNVAEVLR